MITAPNIPELLAKIKAPVDQARAIADKVDAAMLALEKNWLGKVIEHLPGLASWVSAGEAAVAGLHALIDAIDGVVDAYAAPAATAAATTLPQAAAGAGGSTAA
jgi:hypothetical protein